MQPEYYPGFNRDFALVSWRMSECHGQWSFWRRGTGEKHLYHHCRKNDETCPVDYLYEVPEKWECRDCRAHPPAAIVEKYKLWKGGKKTKTKVSK